MKTTRHHFRWVAVMALLLSSSAGACARSYDRSSQAPSNAGNPAYPLTGGPNVRYASPNATTPAPYPVPAASYDSNPEPPPSASSQQYGADVIAAPPPPPSVPYNEIAVADRQLANNVDEDSSVVGYETTTTKEKITVITYVHTYPEPIDSYSRVFWAGRYYYNIQGNFVFWDPFFGGWCSYWGPPFPLVLAWNNFYPWSPYSWAMGFYGPGWYWGGVSAIGFHAHGRPPRYYRPYRPRRIDRGGPPSGPNRSNGRINRRSARGSDRVLQTNRKVAVPTPPSRSHISKFAGTSKSKSSSTKGPERRARGTTKFSSSTRRPQGTRGSKSNTRYAAPPRWKGNHSTPSWGPSTPSSRPKRRPGKSTSPKLSTPRAPSRATPSRSRRNSSPSSRSPTYLSPHSRSKKSSNRRYQPSRSGSSRSGYSHSPSRSRSSRPSGSQSRPAARPRSGPARAPSSRPRTSPRPSRPRG